MTGDPIDLNHVDIDLVDVNFTKTLEQREQRLVNALLKTLETACPELSCCREEGLKLQELVPRIEQILAKRIETGAGTLTINYQVVRKLNTLAGMAAWGLADLIAALRQAVGNWHLNLMEAQKTERLEGFLLRLRNAVASRVKLLQGVDASLQKAPIELSHQPFAKKLWRWVSFKGTLIDLNPLYDLSHNLDGLEEAIANTSHYTAEYAKIHTQAKSGLGKFDLEPFQIFLSLEPHCQERLKEIYLLVKMDELNGSGQYVPQESLDLVVKERLLLSPILAAFKLYYEKLDTALFEESRTLKEEAAQGKLDSEPGRESIEVWLDARRRETNKLKYLVYRVREFFLRTDPDPYVSTRMGWHDRPLGPEPKHTQPLQLLSQSLRHLDSLFHRMSDAVHDFKRSENEAQWKRNLVLVSELYTMIQDLDARESVEEAEQCAVDLLVRWGELDEVCSFNQQDVSYDEFLLRKALIHDKFLVLGQHPRFRELYRQHLAIRGPFKDQAQRERITRIQGTLRQWEAASTQVAVVLDETLGVLHEIQKALEPESVDPKVFEESRRQFLEFLFSFNHFSRVAQKVVCPRSTELRWNAAVNSILALDKKFYQVQEETLLGLGRIE